eukprot:TRINITY_DN92489_c0_g1_i1.p1 TRINITY_DN92489_c0_g1~~TRINITY_DN92489_c0_g1_i1.p1  ORF type:complete len:251 (-),score=25.47 TRINITY_DN92489_c0_g1_i1:361-1023(-)
MAKAMSQAILGRQIDGIWHTGIVVNGNEYYYGAGIQRSVPGQTPFGQPLQVIELGRTQVTQELIDDFLNDISTRFTMQTYNLLTNNCNNFSDEFAQFLTGEGIPSHIVNLPQEVAATPMGNMLLQNFIQPMEQQFRSVGQSQVPTSAQNQSSVQSQQQTSGGARQTQQSNTSQQGASKVEKKDFEELVREEFELLLQRGGLTPDQAAAEALKRAQEKSKA